MELLDEYDPIEQGLCAYFLLSSVAVFVQQATDPG